MGLDQGFPTNSPSRLGKINAKTDPKLAIATLKLVMAFETRLEKKQSLKKMKIEICKREESDHS